MMLSTPVLSNKCRKVTVVRGAKVVPWPYSPICHFQGFHFGPAYLHEFARPILPLPNLAMELGPEMACHVVVVVVFCLSTLVSLSMAESTVQLKSSKSPSSPLLIPGHTYNPVSYRLGHTLTQYVPITLAHPSPHFTHFVRWPSHNNMTQGTHLMQ